MNKKIFTTTLVLALVLAVGILFWGRDESKANLDEFAQCLTDKGAVMYGAEWCAHCQNQKKEFGDSFRLVSYVECPQNTQTCLEKGISGYPTWILADGQKLVGEQELEKLSQKTGCALPQAK